MSTDPLPPEQPAPTSLTESSKDDRTMAMLCHLGGILLSFLVPLIIWLMKKDQSKFVDDQGKEALNFQLTLVIGYALATVLTCVTFGFGIVIFPVVGIVSLIFGIMGGLAANRGERYRYPFAIRLIK
jgi:uncharacterized protein